jgi:transcriptional regulator with GAF, ATPase, and Fis domain
VAPTDSTVLLRGESGTGKEVVARALHDGSRRADRPFVAINCATLSETLLESELFGHEKGAFTGALARKIGKFEVADRGTLFLDEIGEIPTGLQAKLLRALQEREFERLGGTRPIRVDVRVIAATNQDLDRGLKERTFREDLYYRLNVLPINIPPLRERKEDLPYLAEHFVHKLSRDARRECVITDAAMKKLMAYEWPGNVRELENVIERSIVLCVGTELTADDIKLDAARARTSQGPGFLPDGVSLDEYEQSIIREALRRANGNKSQAARLLGITRNALRYRLSQMGLDAGSGE